MNQTFLNEEGIYYEDKCIYCNEKKVRIKRDQDWTEGEYSHVGREPRTFFFVICDNCKKTMCRTREENGERKTN